MSNISTSYGFISIKYYFTYFDKDAFSNNYLWPLRILLFSYIYNYFQIIRSRCVIFGSSHFPITSSKCKIFCMVKFKYLLVLYKRKKI